MSPTVKCVSYSEREILAESDSDVLIEIEFSIDTCDALTKSEVSSDTSEALNESLAEIFSDVSVP